MTTDERIARALTREILRGDWPPSARLPTVRALARRHGVNPATVQRAVARLERAGLVTARQGSGIVVHDPVERADLALLPEWLEAGLAPAAAGDLLAGLLELRRVVAVRLLAARREALLPHLPELAGLVAAVEAAGTPEAARDADLALARRLLRLAGHLPALAVLNALARVLEEVPTVTEAMYGEPARNVASLRGVLAALAEPGGDVEAAIAAVDHETVRRFVAGLERG